MKLFTIGHSTLAFTRFSDILLTFGMEKLIDVRSMPGSRFVPQFNKEVLSELLQEKGIDYAHFKHLGGRRRSREEKDIALVSGWKNSSFRNYASYTMTEEYEAGIKELMSEAENKQVCIMCAESVPWRCHRLLIANTLTVKGAEVFHIMSENKCIHHELNRYGAYAEIKKGKVIYPAEDNKRNL